MQDIIQKYLSFISDSHFPCVAARAAHAHDQIKCFVAGEMDSSDDDKMILEFLYDFVDYYRGENSLYHSATVIFKSPREVSEVQFDNMLWERLQSLADLDAANYGYDARVSSDPSSPQFSFSLKEEGFFIIGLHPSNSRMTRRFEYPTLVFNPHHQFEVLREQHHYESMKKTVRMRDMKISGSINPMLDDFGASSETLQYSGRQYDKSWKCPLHLSHSTSDDRNEDNTSA